MPRPDLIKTKICVNFLSGTCVKDDCTYAHGLPELRQPRMMALPDDLAVEPPPQPSEILSHQQLQQSSHDTAQQLQYMQALQLGDMELSQAQQVPQSQMFPPMPNEQKTRPQQRSQLQQPQMQQEHQQRQQQQPRHGAKIAANGAADCDWGLLFELLGSTMQHLADEVDPESQMAMASISGQLPNVGNRNLDAAYDSDSVALLLEVLDQSMQLWIEEATMLQNITCSTENRWATLVSSALRNKRLAICADGQRLLALDRSGRLSGSEVPAILCLVLSDPTWAHDFPQLVEQCRSFLSTQLAPSAAIVPQPLVGTLAEMEQTMPEQ